MYGVSSHTQVRGCGICVYAISVCLGCTEGEDMISHGLFLDLVGSDGVAVCTAAIFVFFDHVGGILSVHGCICV